MTRTLGRALNQTLRSRPSPHPLGGRSGVQVLPSWDRFGKWTFLANANRRGSRVETGKSFCRRIDMLGKLHRNKKNCCLKRILRQRLPLGSSDAKFFQSQFSRRVSQRVSGLAAPLQGWGRGDAFGFVALRVAFWGRAFREIPGLPLDPSEECTFLANANRRGSRVEIGKPFCRRIDMLG